MSFGLISRAVIGATTAGLMIVSAGGTAFADEGQGSGQSSPLFDKSTTFLPGGLVPLAGTRATLSQGEDGTVLRVRASGLVGTSATLIVFVYRSTAGCNFKTPPAHQACGGPDPNGPGNPPGLCNGVHAYGPPPGPGLPPPTAKYDSCNAANFFPYYVTSPVVNGKASFKLNLGNLPAGAEVQLYVKSFVSTGPSGKTTGIVTFTTPPSSDQQESDQSQHADDGGSSQD